MGESIEALAAVVDADTTGTDTAERQIIDGEMEQGVINRDASRPGPGEDLVDISTGMIEQVERKRPFALE